MEKVREDIRHLAKWGNAATETSTKSEAPFEARVEVIGEGAARHVQVFENGAVVHDSIMIVSAAERPHFYPDDLPFIPGVMAMVSPRGVLWNQVSPSMEERIGEMKTATQDLMKEPRLTGFISTIKSIIGKASDPAQMAEEFKASMPEVSSDAKDALKERLGGIFAPSGAGGEVLAAVLAFHEKEGWVLEKDESAKGPMGSAYMGRRDGQARRITHTDMMGIGGVTVTKLDADGQ